MKIETLKGMLFFLCAVCAGCVYANIVINDTEPDPREITVGAGEELEIRGSGLTANCTVTLVSTAKIKFYTDATISAPISITDNATIETVAGVVGTVAGKITSTVTGYESVIGLTAPGLLKFTGGAQLNGLGNYNMFKVLSGNVEISEKAFVATCALAFVSGHLTVKDGGSWTTGQMNMAGLYMNRSDQNGDAVFEIATGGSASFGGNQNIFIGYKSGTVSKLYVNGGTFETCSADRIMFCCNNSLVQGFSGKGIIEIDNGGVFINQRRIICGNALDDGARIVLGTGTWKGAFDKTYLVDQDTATVARKCHFEVTGDFTLDFSQCASVNAWADRRDDYVDAESVSHPSVDVSWAFAEGAKLTLKGRSTTAANNAMVFHGLAGAGPFELDLAAGNPVNLTLVDAAESLEMMLGCTDAISVTASGTEPRLTAQLNYTVHTAGRTTFQANDAQKIFVGFSSVDLSYAGLALDAANATCYVPPAISSNLTSIVSESGTLVLRRASAIAEGVIVETTGAGALALVNETGFDVETGMMGTKNLVDITSRLVITDKPCSDLTVGTHEWLEVYGDGLGAGNTLTLSTYANVRFNADATIAAATVFDGYQSFTAVSGAHGTFSGELSQTKFGHLTFNPQGRISLTGGGSIGWSHYEDFIVASGDVEITTRPMTLPCNLKMTGGRLRVADGGGWTVGEENAHIRLDQVQTEDVCLEIAKGGFFRVKNNNKIYLGGDTTYVSRIFVNGGTFYRDNADSVFLNGNGVFEIDNGGLYSTCRSFWSDSTTGNAKVILRNGTWDGDPTFIYPNREGFLFKQQVAGTGNCTVSIEGDFTFDIGSFVNVSEVLASVGTAATWTAKPGAILRVRGCDAGAARTFSFSGFAGDGLAVDVSHNANVAFADAGGDVSIGLVVPASAAFAKIIGSGTTAGLNLDYRIEAGATYEIGMQVGAFEGFSSVALRNLTFAADSTLAFPCFGGATQPYVAGTLTLPETQNYLVIKKGSSSAVKDLPAVTASAVVGNPVWTCVGGVRPERAALTVDGSVLRFSYDPPGMCLIFR